MSEGEDNNGYKAAVLLEKANGDAEVLNADILPEKSNANASGRSFLPEKSFA